MALEVDSPVRFSIFLARCKHETRLVSGKPRWCDGCSDWMRITRLGKIAIDLDERSLPILKREWWHDGR